MERYTQGATKWEEIVQGVSVNEDDYSLKSSHAVVKSLRAQFNNWKGVLRRQVLAAELRQAKGKQPLPTDLRVIELGRHADRTMCKLVQVEGPEDLWEIQWLNKDHGMAGSVLLAGLVKREGKGAAMPKYEEDVIQAAARRIMEAQQGKGADVVNLDQAAIERSKAYGAREPGKEMTSQEFMDMMNPERLKVDKEQE